MSEEAQQSPVQTPSKLRQSGRTYSRKRKHVSAEEEDKENHERKEPGESRHEETILTAAYQPLNVDEGLSLEERQALQDTPSKKRVKRTTPSKDSNGRDRNQSAKSTLDSAEENDARDTIVVETPELRTSGRQRKRTWKATDVVEEEPAPKSRKQTPRSRGKTKPTPKAKAKALTNLSPIFKESEDLGASEGGPSILSTPKKNDRTTHTGTEAFISPQQIASASIAVLEEGNTPAKTLEEQPAKSPVKALIQNSAAVTPTPTPKKRGRPPKNRALDGQPPSTSSLLETPSKRSRKNNKLLDIDEGLSSQLTPSKKADRLLTEIKQVQPVSWQQLKGDETEATARPDIQTSRARLETLLKDREYHQCFGQVRNQILRCITGRLNIPLQGLDEEYSKVKSVVKQTVAAGESNSMLVIGPRGSGKSCMVNSILADISTEHPEEFHVIQLNGFIHTDDKLALKEIWRQLGIEMNVDDESMAERGNYADTLASLLAVLSHPVEKPESDDTPAQIAKSIVFVIDEFDLFTTHARQTLLYNLFDIAQSRKAPIVVLGLTTRVDVVESLEKRVKSRFSHRHVFLPRSKTFFAFQQVVLDSLRIGGSEAIAETGASQEEQEAATRYRTLHAAWSDYITSLFGESTWVSSMLRQIFATSRSIPTALSCFVAPVASMTPDTVPDDRAFASQPLLPSDSKLDLLASLTEAELALLVAAARLDIILDVDTCNFNMAFDEYVNLAERARVQASASGARTFGSASAGGRTAWSRAAALAAWERLEILELIMPLATAGYGAGSGLADVGRAGKLMRCDVSLEEIKWSGLPMSQQMMKWCKEI